MNPEKIAGSPFAIGALGAIITAIKFTPGASVPERIVNVVSGSAFAGFVTPALVEWLHMSSPAYSSGAAFPLVTTLGFAMKLQVAVVEKLAVLVIALWLVAYALTALM